MSFAELLGNVRQKHVDVKLLERTCGFPSQKPHKTLMNVMNLTKVTFLTNFEKTFGLLSVSKGLDCYLDLLFRINQFSTFR